MITYIFIKEKVITMDQVDAEMGNDDVENETKGERKVKESKKKCQKKVKTSSQKLGRHALHRVRSV